MKKVVFRILISSFLLTITANCFASISNPDLKEVLLQKYLTNYSKKEDLVELKKYTLSQSGKSVEALIEVMKNGKYPEKNRWIATFMLGQIMGKKSAPFIAKFLKHPSWVMKMASLKTLLALKQDRYSSEYARLLNDDSLLVREQALENLRLLSATSFSPQIWSMLYDKKNYYQPTIKGKPLKLKRTNIIKNVIATVGDLKFEKAKTPLLKMIQKNKYNDIFPEMDSALTKLTGAKSPDGDLKAKRVFWQRNSLNTTIE